MNTMMRSEEINSSSFVHLAELWNLSCSEPLPLLLSMELPTSLLDPKKGPESGGGFRRQEDSGSPNTWKGGSKDWTDRSHGGTWQGHWPGQRLGQYSYLRPFRPWERSLTPLWAPDTPASGLRFG